MPCSNSLNPHNHSMGSDVAVALILEMRLLLYKKGQYLAQGHTAN